MEIEELVKSMLAILRAVGIPLNDLTSRRQERVAKACLAVAGVMSEFKDTSNNGVYVKTREIIEFENKFLGEKISSGSYDDIRRKDLRILVEMGLVVSSSAQLEQATNNPMRGYALQEDFVRLLQAYGTREWDVELKKFLTISTTLCQKRTCKRRETKYTVKIQPDVFVELSVGEHNRLQKLVIEEFLPRFGYTAEILYLGDTSNKRLYMNKSVLDALGVFELGHEELPDVIAYSAQKNFLYLIEAVYSTGPMDESRVGRLCAALKCCRATTIFVTAFLDKKAFRRWSIEIAWETEVWIASAPDHMIHFNGDRFLSGYK